MHWADVVAEKLLESGSEHVISSGITPSGPIHLGSMREILTADAIVKAVNDKGGKAKLVYVADNAVESKASFGDEYIHRKNHGKQVSKYVELYGQGILVYWYGYLDVLKSRGYTIIDRKEMGME